MNDELEQEYLHIIKKYSTDDIQSLCHMLSNLVMMHEAKALPYDVLGELFIDLELGSKHNGQFFTPFNIAELMAKKTMQM